jgi:hypothetical protein
LTGERSCEVGERKFSLQWNGIAPRLLPFGLQLFVLTGAVMLIFLSVCLLASPNTCKEERLDWSFEDIGYMSCFTHSQEALVQWQSAHPLWRVTRWRCVARKYAPRDL